MSGLQLPPTVLMAASQGFARCGSRRRGYQVLSGKRNWAILSGPDFSVTVGVVAEAEGSSMYRRVVCLLLLPTVLLTQWASVGKCHGNCDSGGDAPIPHIHLCGLPFTTSSQPAADRPHTCTCHSHHDEHDDGEEFALTQESSDRDESDVLYLPTSLIYGWFSGRSSTGGIDDLTCVPSLHLTSFVLLPVGLPACRFHPLLFPSVSACPTYLRILTLLI